jgi:hypothetical protein
VQHDSFKSHGIRTWFKLIVKLSYQLILLLLAKVQGEYPYELDFHVFFAKACANMSSGLNIASVGCMKKTAARTEAMIFCCHYSVFNTCSTGMILVHGKHVLVNFSFLEALDSLFSSHSKQFENLVLMTRVMRLFQLQSVDYNFYLETE